MHQRFAIIVIMLVAMLAPQLARGQDDYVPPDIGDGRIPYYKGYNWRVDENGDSVIVYYLTDLYVFRPVKFKNAKEKQEYDRLVRNVKLTLPYAKLIAETLVETYEYIETLPEAEREPYIKNLEKEIFNQYKPVLRRFSRTQAKILIKLVQRETHQSSYEIVRAFLGTFRAAFWQGFGKLFGVSLKGEYKPESNKEDARIEMIASQAELGIL